MAAANQPVVSIMKYYPALVLLFPRRGPRNLHPITPEWIWDRVYNIKNGLHIPARLEEGK